MVIVQNKNMMVSPLDMADIVFTIRATLSVLPKANKEKNLPSNWKKGAPGGCPTWSL